MYKPYVHISKNFCHLVESLNTSLDDLPLLKKQESDNEFYLPKINISEKDKEVIWNKLKKYNEFPEDAKIVVINSPFDDKLGIRSWPINNYVGLIGKLLKHNDIFVVLIGLKFKKIDVLSYENCINLIGKTTIKELIILFNISDVLFVKIINVCKL